jgi:ubiquinone/menaquinone biosynthesis C-methylase UbiE
VALPFRAGAFDWVLCSRVLSHVADLAAALGELARTLKPGGECLITDVHPEHGYEHVRIPGPAGMIGIETYKHPVEAVTASAKAHGLGVESLATYRLADLTESPPRAAFAKLFEHPDRPIFYVTRMIRQP